MNYIGHLAFGLEAYKYIQRYIKNKEEFLTGCVAPDIAIPDAITKNEGHYRDKSDSFFKSPDIEHFLKKYKNRLNEDFVIGYFCHLFADFVFCDLYMVDIIKPLDNENNLYNKKDAPFVYIKKQRKKVKAEEFKKNNPIYDDYDLTNYVLMHIFDIPRNIRFTLNDPKIDEIDANKLKNIDSEVKSFLNSGEVKNKKTQIIFVQAYCDFILEYSKEFTKLYKNLINKKPM